MSICETCMHNKVCAEVDSLHCRSDFIWYKAESGCPHYSTADVAPRAEVDDWEEIAKGYQKMYEFSYEKQQVELAEAKANVAREIFEEITEWLTEQEIALRDRVYSVKDPDAIDGVYDKIYAIENVLGFIDELKKKYAVQAQSQFCRDCANDNECEKATHFENYRFDGCEDFKKKYTEMNNETT